MVEALVAVFHPPCKETHVNLRKQMITKQVLLYHCSRIGKIKVSKFFLLIGRS